MKTVLLTGGTGSFGSGFVRTLISDPEVHHVRVYSRDEHKQQDLRKLVPSEKVSFFMGDVRDRDRLSRVAEGCQWIVHAAALKQAPVGEVQPQEFIKTNVFGSMNVVEAALSAKAEKCLLISTDKAVEPINLYGATKMCAERVFLQATKMQTHTKFACTRYGNVAGSRGTIIPIFKALKDAEPTPVTEPDATRFWISLDEAYKFVLKSLKDMQGGEVFIPKLKSWRVIDLAEAMRPGKPVIIIGHRDGDKKHEVLSVNGTRYSSDKNDFMSIEEIRAGIQ